MSKFQITRRPSAPRAAGQGNTRLARIARACRRLHAGERFDGDFDMFAIQRRYRAVVAERQIAIPAGYADLMGRFYTAARELAVTRYAWPGVAAQLAGLYERLLAGEAAE